jgi:predicted nucleic acid-binding protein
MNTKSNPDHARDRALAVEPYGSIAGMPKLTFSFDDETVETLRKTSERTRKPQSLIVREALAHYARCSRTTRHASSAPPRLCAASLNPAVRRPRGPDVDIAIAACAFEDGARVWTLNPDDFRDMPGLQLYDPAAPATR